MEKRRIEKPYRRVSRRGRGAGRRRRPIGRRAKLLLGGVLVWCAYLFLGGDYGLVRIVYLRREIAEAEAQIRLVKAKNAALRRECELLRGDASTIQRIARDRLGMVEE